MYVFKFMLLAELAISINCFAGLSLKAILRATCMPTSFTIFGFLNAFPIKFAPTCAEAAEIAVCRSLGRPFTASDKFLLKLPIPFVKP